EGGCTRGGMGPGAAARRAHSGAAGGTHCLAEPGRIGYDKASWTSGSRGIPRSPASFLLRPAGMPAMNVTCPECNAVLRSSKPVQPGKAIKCPKCGETFPAPGDSDAPPRPRPTTRAQPAGRQTNLPKRPRRPHDDDDDDEGPGTYAVLKDE